MYTQRKEQFEMNDSSIEAYIEKMMKKKKQKEKTFKT
jgi:hypothetical protein